MTDKTNLDQLSYEQAFEELQEVINLLEAGDKPLEETLSLYERGQALYQHCTSLLDKAELKVQQINLNGALENFEG